MLSPIFNKNDSIWNINMLLNPENESEIEDEEEDEPDDDDDEHQAKENTPKLNDDIFNEEHTSSIVEMF
jgi:hypothetical protein